MNYVTNSEKKHSRLVSTQENYPWIGTDKKIFLCINTLIMPIITYGIELWGGAYFNKYISQIDKFINRAHRN
jgi:hypothetical protein